MINLTNEEFAEVIGEVYKEVNKENADAAFFVVMVGAMIGASAEEKTEKKEGEKEDCVVYKAGDHKICIATRYDNKAHLVITYKDRIAVDRMLDSLHKAYEYAFNILIAR